MYVYANAVQVAKHLKEPGLWYYDKNCILKQICKLLKKFYGLVY